MDIKSHNGHDNSDLKALTFTRNQVKLKHLADILRKKHIAPLAAEIDQTGRYPIENIKILGEHGLLGLGISEKRGGTGSGDFLSIILVMESLAKGCASTAMAYLMHSSTIPYLSIAVSEGQHKDFLQPIIDGKFIGALAMSEPGTGSRLWHMNSHAEKNGDEVIINSFKSFVTSSKYADFYLVPVRSSADSMPNELSVFWIDGKHPNIKAIGDWDGMGLRGNSSTPIHFDNCRIPANNQIGDTDTGFSLMMAYSLPIYLVGMAAIYLGIAENAYERAVEKVKSRKYTDTKDTGGNLTTIQRSIGEMKTKICQLRASVYRGARLITQSTKVFDLLFDAGLLAAILDNVQEDKFFIELAQLKVAATETAASVTNLALEVSGGQYYKRGNTVERCFRDARAGSLMGPANDILKVIIGKRELGLPYPWDEFIENQKQHLETKVI